MSDDILTELRQRGAAIERQGETNWIYDDAADEIERLRFAISRLVENDATLSMCDGNVTVTLDGTLTDAEREAIHQAAIRVEALCQRGSQHMAATLRGLLERTK